MGLFSRRRDDGPSTPSTDPSSVSDRAESTTPVASGTGPWDVTDAPERPESVGRIDLVPARPGGGRDADPSGEPRRAGT